MGMQRDVLDAIETIYQIECAPNQWLRNVGQQIYHQLGAGVGLFGFEYRIVDGKLIVNEELRLEMPGPQQLPIREALEMLPIDFVRKTFATPANCATQSQATPAELRPFVAGFMAPLAVYGWHDFVCFGGVDPEGNGLCLHPWLPRTDALSPRMRNRWTCAAVHACTALRLRRRFLATADVADAVLTPTGKVEHAEGEAKLDEARASLRAAVRDVERARGRLRRSDPDEAVGLWKGLVSARWSLVDRFESDGRRYVLARRNDVALRGPTTLTPRERQAVAYAALGHRNKLIAYAMGVTASTVSVLLCRASRKLNTSSREELIAAFKNLTH
jgi:DNA-binding CsgD family transcriptional regulator